jgi:hypothetical protein
MMRATLQSLFTPKATPYTAVEWSTQPWQSRLRMSAQAWALDGYGSPPAIYALYGLKVVVYIGIWMGLCTLGDAPDWQTALLSADGFKKAILWSMLFEVLGLGCGSGPLTGRYLPPVTAPLHFLRPHTLRLPPWPSIPVLGGSTSRSWLHVLLYLALILALGAALIAPTITPALVAPVVVLLLANGLSDKTIFLAARAEHYGATAVCFLFSDDWIAGAIAVQLAIWLWAGIAKLNRHFPAVITVMMSNSAWMRWRPLRRAMYRDFPTDLRPSRLAATLAHLGTATELGFPLLLWFGDGGWMTIIGLIVMVIFHAYITSHVPMAVPLEWNVMVVFGGFFLFGQHAQIGISDISNPWLVGFLFVSLIAVPLLGNIRPQSVSFLMAMRYYAGNWAWSLWLFKDQSEDKLKAIKKASEHPRDQLARLYPDETVVTLMSKVPAFRAMHIQGRAMGILVPMAVDDIERTAVVDGELIAGIVLGYNFGCGHLHDHRLLAKVQALCHFEPGELRHIQIEAQPLGQSTLHWEIRDAHDGLIETGDLPVSTLLERQPWATES